jgi:hypothetical protein
MPLSAKSLRMSRLRARGVCVLRFDVYPRVVDGARDVYADAGARDVYAEASVLATFMLKRLC